MEDAENNKFPLNLTVIFEPEEKPVPLKLTECPGIPLVGFSDIFGTILKFLEGEFVPSVAETECIPAVPAGTTKEALNDPLELELTVPTALPSKLIVTVEDGSKNCPLTTKLELTGPWLALRVKVDV